MGNEQWLNDANAKFESCVYAYIIGTCSRCSLGGYPILDCPKCNSYKEREQK